MRTRLFGLLMFIVMSFSGLPAFAVDRAHQPKPYDKSPGVFEVAVTDYDWFDEKRQRQVPVRIYYPQGRGPYPVVVFSHGLGGSREGYQY